MDTNRDNFSNCNIADEILRAGSQYLTILQSRLRQYVRPRYTASDEECEDLVSDILSVVIHGIRGGQFRGDDLRAFNAYVYGIARLKIIKAVERTNRRHELSQHLVTDDLPIGRITDPETRVIRTDLLERVYNGLDKRCRELIRLKFIDGWTDDEIAAYKRMTKNAASTALSRCLKKARQLRSISEILYKTDSPPD